MERGKRKEESLPGRHTQTGNFLPLCPLGSLWLIPPLPLCTTLRESIQNRVSEIFLSSQHPEPSIQWFTSCSRQRSCSRRIPPFVATYYLFLATSWRTLRESIPQNRICAHLRHLRFLSPSIKNPVSSNENSLRLLCLLWPFLSPSALSVTSVVTPSQFLIGANGASCP